MFDLTKFSDIDIYVGGNDSSNSSDNVYFEEKYEQLLQHIKSQTQTSKIHLCTSCHRGDTDVEETNDVIKRLSEEHEVKCIEVSKGAKIRNRYNQVPHLTQDTNGKVTNSQLDSTNESQEVALSQQVTTRHI